jgi:hypothetical protein
LKVRYNWILACGLLSSTFLFAGDKRDFLVLGKSGENIVLQPHVAPILYVKQVSGPMIPANGSLACQWKQGEIKTPNEDTIKILEGTCESGIVVHLVGIDLNH